MPTDLILLLTVQTLVAAVFHWIPRWGGGRFHFSVAVDPAFPTSDEGRQIVASYRARVWTHWALSLVLVTALYRWGLQVAVIGLLWLPVGVEIAFVRAQRRVRPHGAPPSSLRTADLAPRPALPGGWLCQSGPFLILAAVAWAVWRGRPSIDALQAHATRTFHPPPFGGAIGFVIGAAVVCGLLLALANGIRTLARHPTPAGRRSTLLTLLATEYLLAAMTAAIFGPVSIARGEQDLRFMPFVLLGLVLAFLGVVVRLSAAAAVDAARADPGGDERWKWGLFYRNADDEALFVPKRVGIGYTLNFARPGAWVLSGALLLFLVASMLLPVLLRR